MEGLFASFSVQVPAPNTDAENQVITPTKRTRVVWKLEHLNLIWKGLIRSALMLFGLINVEVEKFKVPEAVFII